MARSFLFGGSTSGQSQNKYLVEFRAGKMFQKGDTVHPDKRKGTIFVYQGDDALMHLCWKDRTSGKIEDDLIIFPEDAEFKRVAQCTTGRVYVLKFKSNSRKCFYWMQEPKTEKDDEYCSKVNEYLNHPPNHGLAGSSGSQGSSTNLQSELSNLGDGDLQNLLNNMSQQQLVQLLGGMSGIGNVGNLSNLLGRARPSARSSSASTPTAPAATQATVERTSATSTTSSQPTTPAPAATTSQPTPAQTAPNIQLSDLQNILSGLNVPANQSSGTGATNIDLSSAITAEALQPLLNNAELMERIRDLLPPSDNANLGDQVRCTVQSPQFQQALSVFSAALQSGQLGPLMLQFGMSQDVVNAANSGDMEAFIRALQQSTEEKQDKDEEMSLD